MFNKHTVVSVNFNVIDIPNKSSVGSSEISFSLKELLFILLSQDVEVTTILDYGTTESQGNDIMFNKHTVVCVNFNVIDIPNKSSYIWVREE
jgi:hypothetical protein